MNVNFKEKLIKIAKILFKVFIWTIIYFIGIITCDNIYNETVSQGLVTGLFILIIYISWMSNKDYKYWLEQAEYNEFQKRFTNQYKPIGKIFPIIWLFFFAHYCSNSELVLLYIIWVSYDLWERRYLTSNIKQDLILEKLKKEG